ncbi:E3 ubiquitin-protein ligase RBBP6 isoform X2 [Phyllopteryx taeniolatus]|uniref:E3 ubiquitin-protein ligase RBBP6 isoform X2 n=1 Tax=Phyllopteryx taeniolatus TaxID=161469 RepID=UPI002AD54FE2|nr:E3 ubiquitin-protein ligase RBBP6 isoform X2 [Phyllopteryx taeniolatus]
MTHIHYKFSSKLSYATVVFDGPHVTLTDLKEQIMGRERLRAGDCDLQITDAQTKEEYTNEEGLIPKGSSVIVRRVPNMRVKSFSVKKTQNTERSDAHCHFSTGAIKAMDDNSSSKTLPLFSKMVNLAAADVSEEDKIKVVMNQSSYNPMTYNKKFGGMLPANYTCYRCGNTGHHIRKCPSTGDKNFDAPKIKKSTGIPRSFMVEVDDPNIKGAMMTNCGRFAIPAIDAQAYAIGKKEKHPFLHQEECEPVDEKIPVPEELQCLICHDLLVDSVVIPCCGNSYCDECIRTALLDSEEHICPTCNQADVSPDTLIANKFLRQAVNNFKKEKGDTRNLKKSGIPQSLTATPTPIPVPTPLTVQQQKIQQSTPSQQTDVHESGAHPASSLPPCVEAEVKTQDVSVADIPSVAFLNKDPTAVPSQPMILVHNDPVQKSSLGQTPTSLHSSFSSSVFPMGVTTEIQHLPPSSSSQPPAPPPFFPSHHFHSFPPAQQYPRHPPGHQVALPNWTHPNPQGAPLPPLISSSSPSIPPLNQRDWSSHHRHRRERSPRTRSSFRRSSRSKSKSSRSSSQSSRSRSRSHGRSRPRSPYSHHRVPHTRTNPSHSYSYGYKRSHSPTASSSSSPREGSHSTSQSAHRKKRHHNKKSSHRSYKSRRRAEHSPASSRQAEGPSGQCYANEPTSSQDTNNDFYQQWKKQYKEWYEKYFSTYVSHYHRLPPSLLSLPPPPNPPWADRAENHTSHKLDSFTHLQHTRRTSTHPHSPPSQSSSDSRSSHSQSSSEGRSPPSRSSSVCSYARSPCDTRSPPSENTTPHRGSAKKDGRKHEATANSEQLPALKSEQERMRKYDEVPEDNTCSPDAARPKGKEDKRRHRHTCSDSLPDRDAFESVQNPLASNKNEREKQQRPESESKCKKGKDSISRRLDEERRQKVKSREKAHKVEKGTHPDVYKASKSHRKGKGACEEENKESHIITTERSGYIQTNLEIPKGECSHTVEKEKQQEQKKKQKEPLSPRVKNIWEEGMQVKPQKKISININLDGKRPEEKTAIQEWSRSERSDVKENGEKLEAEIPRTAKQQATGLRELRGADEVDCTESKKEDERQNVKENEEDKSMKNDDRRKERGIVKENEGDERVTNDDEEKQRQILEENEDERVTNDDREKERHIMKENGEDRKVTNEDGEKERQIVKENEEDESVRHDIGKERGGVKEIEEDDRVTNDEREKDKSVATTEKMTTEEENGEELPEESKPKQELVVGVKMSDEDTASVMMSHTSERPNITMESVCNTSMVDRREGEESLERIIEVTTPPREHKHSEEDTLEFAPLSILDKKDPEEDEQEVLPVAPPPPPVTPGQLDAHGQDEEESQRSDEMQTGEENRERNSCLALPRGQYISDTEMEGNVGADRPQDHEKEWKGEEDKKVSNKAKDAEQELLILPNLQSSMTSHHSDRKGGEQEVKIDASKESHTVNHSECIKKLCAILDIQSSTTEDPDHIYQYHDSDNTDSKSSNKNNSLPYHVQPFGKQQRPPESSRSSLALKHSDAPQAILVSKNQREPKPHALSPYKHSDRTTLKVRPQSREELWKRYKLEKLLKESQHDRAAKEPEPEKEAAQHSTHEAKPERARGEKPSSHSSSSSSSVTKSEHERRPKKHKDKRHGDTELEDLERKHKKSKKHDHSH